MLLLGFLMFCLYGLSVLVKISGKEPDWGLFIFNLLFFGILYIGRCITHG
jgi:hypothetical protein